MFIYLKTDGGFINVQPTTITQGSNKIQDITVLAEGVSQSSSINISFELPNGQIINGGLMTPQDSMVINNEVINSWTYNVVKSVTNFPGILKISMMVTDVNGGQLGTYIASVTITKGIQPILPVSPSLDWYEDIARAYAFITGKISTLELGKVKEVELKAEDFILNTDTGLYETTIYLTDLAMVNDGHYIVQGFYDDGAVFRSVGLDFSYNKSTFEFTIYSEQAEDYKVVIASRVAAQGRGILTLTNPADLDDVDYDTYGAVRIVKTTADGTYTLVTPEHSSLCYDLFIMNLSNSTNAISVNGTSLAAGKWAKFTWAGQWILTEVAT